jgi:hypothetical protein
MELHFGSVHISESFACHAFSHIRQEEKIADRIAGVNQALDLQIDAQFSFTPDQCMEQFLAQNTVARLKGEHINY